MIWGVIVGSKGYEFSLKKDSSEVQDEIPELFLQTQQVCTVMTLELQKILHSEWSRLSDIHNSAQLLYL